MRRIKEIVQKDKMDKKLSKRKGYHVKTMKLRTLEREAKLTETVKNKQKNPFPRPTIEC